MTSSQNHFKATTPHVVAKHALLAGYLSAWFSILGKGRYPRLVYVDGFAGPGKFEDRTDGSPVRALKVARGFVPPLSAELHFFFIEKSRAFAEHLKREIPALQLPQNFKWKVEQGTFEEVVPAILDELDRGELAGAPVFAFVDPFGVKGAPFDLIRRILARPSSEVFVTFMNEGVRRCIEGYPQHVDALLGAEGASESIARATDKVASARQLYRGALDSTRAHVCVFQVRDARNRPIYDLFFATHSERGLIKMKEAMWKVDRSGFFLFSDAKDPAQQSFFSEIPGERFAPLLWEKFKGRRVNIEEIVRFADLSPTYLSSHARAAIQAMERAHGVSGKHVRVERAPCKGGRRASLRQFPIGTTVEFLE